MQLTYGHIKDGVYWFLQLFDIVGKLFYSVCLRICAWITSQTLILSLVVGTAEAACPLCQQVSHRIHSRYTRTLADLLSGGKALRLLVLVRRFFCENETCARKIFAERLPELTRVYARRTSRDAEALAELGFALGGKAAAALGTFLGLPGSRMTILRILRKTPVPVAQTPKMLGIDEWAYRRGKSMGHSSLI